MKFVNSVRTAHSPADVIRQNLQGGVIEGQVSQSPKLRETIRQPAERPGGKENRGQGRRSVSAVLC